MAIKTLLATLMCLLSASCSTILTSDFNGLSGNLSGDIPLPGLPRGDRMLVTGYLVGVSDFNADDNSLFIHRNLKPSQAAPRVFFDPIDAGSPNSMYFSWQAQLNHTSSPNTSLPVVVARIKDMTDDSPSFFSKLTLLLGPQSLTVMTTQEETPIGLGVTGSHGVLIRIDPDTKWYSVTVSGEGVSVGGSATTTGVLPSSTTLDANNIGLELSFDDADSHGISQYQVDTITISKRQP